MVDHREDPMVAALTEEEAGDISFLQQIDGREDPIALYLKSEAAKDDGKFNGTTGVYDGDHADILAGVQALRASTLTDCRGGGKTFALSDDLLTEPGADPFPRLISVTCADKTARASEFFIAASFSTTGQFEGNEVEEVDLKNLEMFGWDPRGRGHYQFYETFELQNGAIAFEASPTRCRGCHLTAASQEPLAMRMTPIMNELQNPWTHWNAVPEADHNVNFFFEARAAFSENFRRLFLPLATLPVAEADLKDSSGNASEFEAIIKQGHKKVAAARTAPTRETLTVGTFTGDRTVETALTDALDMLRPVFCVEQLNYVSEQAQRDGTAQRGELFASVALNPGVETAYTKVKSDWSEIKTTGSASPWIGLDLLTLPTVSEAPLDQIPVRGNSDAVIEQRLISPFIQVLKPLDIVRVNALDWRNSVFSPFRCELWQAVKKRAVDTTPPSVGEPSPRAVLVASIEAQIAEAAPRLGRAPRLSDLGWPLFKEMMQYEGESLILQPAEGREFEEWPGAAPNTDRPLWVSAPLAVVDFTGEAATTRDEALVTAIRGNSLPNCNTEATEEGAAVGRLCKGDMPSLGQLYQRRLESFTTDKDGGRDRLAGERDTRICYVTQRVQPEEADVRFVDVNVEALAFEECCGVPQKDYLEFRKALFGENTTKLTTQVIGERKRIIRVAHEVFTRLAALSAGARADFDDAKMQQLATAVADFLEDRSTAKEQSEEFQTIIGDARKVAGDRVRCGFSAFQGMAMPELLPAWQEAPLEKGNADRICAAGFTPERFSARPSLPAVGDCVTRNHFWKYDEEVKEREADRLEERVRARSSLPASR